MDAKTLLIKLLLTVLDLADERAQDVHCTTYTHTLPKADQKRGAVSIACMLPSGDHDILVKVQLVPHPELHQ